MAHEADGEMAPYPMTHDHAAETRKAIHAAYGEHVAYHGGRGEGGWEGCKGIAEALTAHEAALTAPLHGRIAELEEACLSARTALAGAQGKPS